MYRLRNFLQSVNGLSPDQVLSDELFCAETDIKMTFRTNDMRDSLAAYTYTLVQRGQLNFLYNGRMLTLQRGDLYIYSPGFQVTIVSGTEDYHAICLMADEGLTLEMPTIRDIIRAAYLPDRLCFADQSSFSKFFVRMKGVPPKKFRMER